MTTYSFESYSHILLKDTVALLEKYPGGRQEFDRIMGLIPGQKKELKRQLNQHLELKAKFDTLFIDTPEANANPFYTRNIAIYLKNTLTALDNTLYSPGIMSRIDALIEFADSTTPGDNVIVDEKSKAYLDMFREHNNLLLAPKVSFTVFDGMYAASWKMIPGAKQKLKDVEPVLAMFPKDKTVGELEKEKAELDKKASRLEKTAIDIRRKGADDSYIFYEDPKYSR